MPGEHSDGWESYWTYPDRWGGTTLRTSECITILEASRRQWSLFCFLLEAADDTETRLYTTDGNTYIFRSYHGVSPSKNIYICIYVHTVRLWPPLGTMRWMIPFRRHCFLVAFVHRYRLGYIPSSHYTYILFREQFIYIYIYRYIIFIYIYSTLG